MPVPLFMCRHTWLNRFVLLTAVTVGWADNRKSACGAAVGQALATPRRKRVGAGQALAAIRRVKRRFARKRRREGDARRPKALAAVAGAGGDASRRRPDPEHTHAEPGVRADVGESRQSHEARKQPHLGFVGVVARANSEAPLGGLDSSRGQTSASAAGRHAKADADDMGAVFDGEGIGDGGPVDAVGGRRAAPCPPAVLKAGGQRRRCDLGDVPPLRREDDRREDVYVPCCGGVGGGNVLPTDAFEHLGFERGKRGRRLASVSYVEHAAPGEPGVERVEQPVVQQTQFDAEFSRCLRHVAERIRLWTADVVRRPRGEGGNAAGALGGNPGRKVEDVPDGGVQPTWRGMDCPRGVELDEHCARHASVLPGMPAYALLGPPWLRQGRPTVDMKTADGRSAAANGTGRSAGYGGRPE